MSKYDANQAGPYDDLIRQASTEVGVSYDLLRKVGWIESKFDPNAKSPTGPIGMFQFTKATGRGIGLNISDDGLVDDRRDPKKATYAAARLLKQLTDKYQGDELKAALAYNQGENSSSIKAYNAGDLHGVAAEGLKYMTNLTDVAKSNNLELVKGFAGITPTAKPFAVEDYTTDAQALVKPVDTSAAEPVDANLKAAPQERPQTFTEQFKAANNGKTEEQVNGDKGFFTGTGSALESGLKNSVLGMAGRAITGEYGGSVFDLMLPAAANEYQPQKEDFDRWEQMGIQPEYWSVISGGDAAHVTEREQMALKNQAMDAETEKAGTGAKLIGGLAGAIGDPLSYIPMAGNSFKGMKLLSRMVKGGIETAGINVASEGWRTSVAGGHEDYTNAALGGLMLGGILGGLARGQGGHLADDFSPTANRIEARESSMNMGMEDVSKKSNVEVHSEHAGVAHGDATHNPEDTVLEDGSVITAGSFVDPKTQALNRRTAVFEDEGKAAAGIRLGGLSEIGQVVLRSANEKIRGVGARLFRPATGVMEEGGFGFKGMTMDDIAKYGEMQDHSTYSELYKAAKEATGEAEWHHGVNRHLTKDEAWDKISERVAKAVEAEDQSLYAALSKGEKKLYDIVKSNYQRKAELLEDPAKFGLKDAPPVANDLSHYRERYTPRIYSREKKLAAVERFGSRENLQRAIADSWAVSYRKNPAELNKLLSEGLAEGQQVTPEMVDKFLMDKAYGISHSDVFDGAHIVDEELRGGAGIENNSFLEMRVPLRTDGTIVTPTGTFAIDDLREWNISRNMQRYNRRMNGTIAIHGSTGMTEDALKQHILDLRKEADAVNDRNMHQEIDAMLEGLKIATGRARKDPDGIAETMMRSMTDLAFFAKNAYMGVQNVTEAAALVNKGGLRCLLANIPMLKHMAFSNGLEAGEMKTVHAILWGKELDDSIRPTSKEVIRALRESSTAPDWAVGAVGRLKHLTGELAQRSPWTKVLKETTNMLTDAARQNVLGDIVGHVHNGAKSKFLDEKMMKAIGVTEEQAAGLKDWVTKYTTQDANGKISWKTDELRAEGRNDPAAFTLWRIGDYMASETLMRPDRISLQNAKQYGALAQMFLQFKTFTLRSLNGKFLRTVYQSKNNGRHIDSAMQLLTSLGLSATYYVAQAHAKAYGLPEEQRKAYLRDALSEKAIMSNMVTRSSLAGSPISAWNVFASPFGADIGGTYGRSSILAQEKKEKRQDRPIMRAMGSEAVQDWADGVLQQVPAFNLGANAYALGHNALGMLSSRTPADKLQYATGVYNAGREFIPNDPLTQQVWGHLIKQHGMYVKPRL
ncbi:MAG: internal virion protein D [Spirochaetia bacterium]|nr:internal virion protein D [Spirochaetia bacterium]